MLAQILDHFFSKVFEKLTDYAQGTVTEVRDYRVILEALEKNLRSLSDKASDVKQEVKHAELSGKKKRKQEVKNWLAEVRKLEIEFGELVSNLELDGFISRFLGEDRAQILTGRVERLVEQSRHFGELVLEVSEYNGVPLLTRRLVGEKFGENLERIWNFLRTNKVSCIGIHGMGGVGKTTLAKHIHNQFLKVSQECVFWITVSQVFTMRTLQDEIARTMHLDLSNEENEDKRVAKLNQALSKRKSFLLILDDVWKSINLEKLGDPLSLKGGKLIITTRSMQVCNQIGCQKVVQVKTLNKHEAWNLFKETLGGQVALTPQVREIAKCMAEKCGGLPLGIITIAGSMKGKSGIHEWRNALTELQESIMSEDDNEEKVFKILKYSFDQLDQGEEKYKGHTKLQRCFLYCCLYPEDQKIVKSDLINDFISEELLDTKRSRRKQVDQGHATLNKLVNMCLLESDESWWVKMHDLVRAMALKITKGKYLRVEHCYSLKEVLDEEECWAKDLEKISLISNDVQDITIEWSPNCPKLSTLLLQKTSSLNLIPSPFFLKMHSLQVLNLSFTYIRELPNSLSNLGSLKSLLLIQCHLLECMPNLGNLKELRELNLSGTSIRDVPQGMEELVNLRCLNINASKLKKLPGNLFLNFRNLQSLYLSLHIEAPIKEIVTLRQLEEFRGRVKDVFDFNSLMRCLSSKESTRSYAVKVGEYLGVGTGLLRWDDYKEVFLCGTNLSTEGSRDVTLLASDIQYLTFMECEGLNNFLLDGLQRLNINLKSLEYLMVNDCEGIECIMKYEQFLMEGEESEIPLQSLEYLYLIQLPNFKGLTAPFRRPSAVLASPPLTHCMFSSLKRLWIYDCNKMRKLGLSHRELPNLEMLRVVRCSELKEIIQVAYEHREGNRAFVIHLPKLKLLYLDQLPRLSSICNATMVCMSLQNIEMARCTGLTKLPLVFGQPNYDSFPYALEEIRIFKSEKGWWESLELGHPSLHRLLLPFVKFQEDGMMGITGF